MFLLLEYSRDQRFFLIIFNLYIWISGLWSWSQRSCVLLRTWSRSRQILSNRSRSRHIFNTELLLDSETESAEWGVFLKPESESLNLQSPKSESPKNCPVIPAKLFGKFSFDNFHKFSECGTFKEVMSVKKVL